MQITTTRFGPLEIGANDAIRFPAGLLGLEDCRNWILLADLDNNAVAWLQGVDRTEVALPVVSPRRFVPDYRMRVSRRDLEAIELGDVKTAHVLAILGISDGTLTLNLKAPLLINLQRCLGRQVVTKDDMPVRFDLGGRCFAFRRSA